VYECLEAGWCNQSHFEPENPVYDTSAVWKPLPAESCSGTPTDPVDPPPSKNSLTLKFETIEKALPAMLTTPGIGRRAQQSVSGVLRCKDQDIPISGQAGSTVELKDLGKCDYTLVMNASEGYLPLTTPQIIKFTAESDQHESVTVAYRRPIAMDQLKPLPGYKIELFATGMIQPRQMALGKNVLYVGSSAIFSYVYNQNIADMIYALPLDAAGKPTGIHVVASGLEEPHGVVYRDGTLYYSTTGALWKVDNIDTTYKDPKPVRVLDFPADDITKFPLPDKSTGSKTRLWHQKHPLQFNQTDPNDRGLYTAVGIPCNFCVIPDDPRYGSLLRYDLDSGQSTIIAKGVRNSVGFDWDPLTQDIWFTDNNRQGLTNSDELNKATKTAAVEDFGAPHVFGKSTIGYTHQEFDDPLQYINPNLVDGAIVGRHKPDTINPGHYTPSAYEFGMNVAPLGLKFWNPEPLLDGNQQVVVAAHGAGTTEAPGMEVRRMNIKGGKLLSQLPLINGWVKTPGQFDVYCLTDDCIGRPADFLVMPDNSLLISDDVAGAIYRVTYDASALKKTTLVLRSNTPPAEQYNSMLSGFLIDPQGNSRQFDLAWGSALLAIPGVEYGTYTVRLNDYGKWVPQPRTREYVVSADSPTTFVDLNYVERDENASVEIKVTAPARPAGVTEASWKVELIDTSQATPTQELTLGWGTSVTKTLKYGNYELRYPYYRTQRPEPSLQALKLNEEWTRPDVSIVNYQSVADLGKAMLDDKCVKCHSVDFFKNANMAENWNAAPNEQFVATIRGMKIEGQCDATCGEQVARYLKEDVWKPYLDPGQSIGVRQMRLLSRSEYINSVHDIFEVDIDPNRLPEDKASKGFKYPPEADASVLVTEDAQKLYDVALKVSEQMSPEPLRKAQRDNTVMSEVRSMGHKVFRRVLTNEEAERYTTLFNEKGQAGLMTGLLMSPHFLYRSEMGVPVSGEPNLYRLTPDEVATALSYTFMGTTPDAELMAKATDGALSTQEEIRAEVDRMISTDRGKEQFNRFIRLYTRTAVPLSAKEGLSEQVLKEMIEEQTLFVNELIGSGTGTFEQLFNPGFTFLNGSLAAHYGISGVSGSEMKKTHVADTRGGLLHQGLTQVANADAQATALVRRGIMIREQLYCKEFGPPVELGPGTLPPPGRAISTRENWDRTNGEAAGNGTCWQCHKFMNDTGASMENYDAAGRYRVEEKAANYADFPQMVPIYAGGPFISNNGTDFWASQISGVRDIAKDIPGNPAAQRCMADSYLRFATGARADEGSVGIIKAISDGLRDNGSLRNMMLTYATSHGFTHRQAPAVRK